jgi:hypothetical protein
MLLVFKILLVPVIIGLISVAGKIWGPRLSGMLGGLPVIVAPVLVFVTLDHGTAFGVEAAKAALAGVWSLAIYCFLYALASRSLGVASSLSCGLIGFGVGTWFSANVPLPVLLMLGLVCVTIVAFLVRLPDHEHPGVIHQSDGREIGLRMLAAAALVLLITLASSVIGPRLSGLLAPFPISGTILTGFTHYHSGALAARRLLDGFLKGLFGMALFSAIYATALPSLGIVMTTLLGVVLAVTVSVTANKIAHAWLPA